MAGSTNVVFGDHNKGLQVGVNHGQIHFAAPRPRTPPSPTSNVPFRRDADYVERSEVTSHLVSALEAPAARVALVGFGGVGPHAIKPRMRESFTRKSQIAIEHCHWLRETSPGTWVFWIFASNAARYEQSVQDAAALADIPGRDHLKADIYTLLRDWLRDRRHGPWLIVLDNADEVEFLTKRRGSAPSLFELLPVCDHGRILITSRSTAAASKLAEHKEMIHIMPMKEDIAVALLEKKLGPHAEISALAAALEYMPLAMTQAAAYIQHRGARSSISKYLDKLPKSAPAKKSILDEDEGDLRRDTESQNAIMLTWQISFEHIRQIRPSAADRLSLMSFCDRQSIPDVLLRRMQSDEAEATTVEEDDRAAIQEGDSDAASSDDESEASLDDQLSQDMALLEAFAFVSAMADASTYGMHRLVQLATQRWLRSRKESTHWIEIFTRNLDDAFPRAEYENWKTCQMLVAHARAAMALQIKDETTEAHLAHLLLRAGWFLRDRGALEESEAMSRRSYEIRRAILGESDVRTLASMTNLALILGYQGRFSESEALERKVVEGLKSACGREHPDTLSAMSNLANTYWALERDDEAEQLARSVLEVRKKVFGPDHPDTLANLVTLSAIYAHQRRWSEALPLQREILAATAKARGPEHPETLLAMCNLAEMLWDSEESREPVQWEDRAFDEALQLATDAAAGRTKVLGAEHPGTIMTVAVRDKMEQALTHARTPQGVRHAMAEKMLVDMLAAFVKVRGPDDAQTLEAQKMLDDFRAEHGRSQMLEAMSLMESVGLAES